MDRLENILKDKLQHHQVKDEVPSWEALERALDKPVLPPSVRTRRSRVLLWASWTAAALFLLSLGLWVSRYVVREEPAPAVMHQAGVIPAQGSAVPVAAALDSKQPEDASGEPVVGVDGIRGSGAGEDGSRGLVAGAVGDVVVDGGKDKGIGVYGRSDGTVDIGGQPAGLLDSVKNPLVATGVPVVSGAVVAPGNAGPVSVPGVPGGTGVPDAPGMPDGTGVAPVASGLIALDVPEEAIAKGSARGRGRSAVSLAFGPNLGQNGQGMMAGAGAAMRDPVFSEYNQLMETPVVSESALEHKMPVSFGVMFRRYLTGGLSLDAGLMYTYMRSESFLAGTLNDYKYRQSLHYLGIPVSLSLDMARGKHVRFYVSGGGMAEMALSARGKVQMISSGSVISDEMVHLKAEGVVWSLNGSVGLEYGLARDFGVFLEPGLSYYPDNHNQPSSYRTEHPLNFNFRLGLRKEF